MEITEQKIINSAIDVFNENPSASLDAVALQADISRRTIHRHFKDRTQLLEVCKQEMLAYCNKAMTEAYHGSRDPLKQIELMLYAGIDCGSKYAFLNKIYQRTSYTDLPDYSKNQEYDNVKSKWFSLVASLQNEGVINPQLTVAWIYVLFGSMISATINALNSGDVARNDIKKFAWYSFSRSIGIQQK